MAQKQVWRSIQVDNGGWRKVGEELELNDLQLLEIATSPRQPWVIDGDKWMAVNLILPELRGRTIRRRRLCLLIGRREAVMLHNDPLDEALTERLRAYHHLGDSPTGVLAIAADVVTERFTPILDSVDEAIDKLEDSMIDRASDKQVKQLFHYKKILSDLRRIVLPTMLALNSLSDGRFLMVDSKHSAYLRDSYDYAWRAHELIDTQRDLLSSVLDTYLSVMSNRMNDIMKRLTIVTTIFMPMTFITGFGGMNFQDIPFDNHNLFVLTMISMMVIPLMMVIYFHRKKWF